MYGSEVANRERGSLREGSRRGKEGPQREGHLEGMAQGLKMGGGGE